MPGRSRCSRCDDEAIICLHYCNRHLCAGHFMRMFTKRFRSTVREFGMIKKGERIAVALSGGKDSTVLLHCMQELSKDLPMELVAITIDEGIAGYRNATLQIAKKEAKNLGIEHKIVSFKKEIGKPLDSIIKKHGGLPCSWCGVFRRGLLNSAALGLEADKLAMGHNLDDMAQTVLMNIFRNEPSRIGRMLDPHVKYASFVPRIRPLMRTPEKEVAIYAMARSINIDHRECPYAYSAFRQCVRRQLNEMEELHPGTKYKILSSFLSIEKPLKDNAQEKEFRSCTSCGSPGASSICKFCDMRSKL